MNEEGNIEKYELIPDNETNEHYELDYAENTFAENFLAKKLDTYEERYIKDTLKEHFDDLEEEIFACGSMRENEQLDVLELCCEENSLLTETIRKMGGKAERAGHFNGCDLMKASGRKKVREIIRLRKPRWIWISFPCGATSSIQHLNEITD